MFITKKVFDPELVGKAVHIGGQDNDGRPWDGLFLVKGVDAQYIQLIDNRGKDGSLHMELFEHEDLLKLQILELPRPVVDPVEVMETLPAIEIEDIEDEELPAKKHKTGFKRKQGTKHFRSELQYKVDNNHLEFMLKEKVKPLKLEEIITRMQENHGHWHWNERNGSGFVQFAMKCGKRIKKFGHGFYGYDWEAAE